jgi:pyrrolidone-carboxylate peptidase
MIIGLGESNCNFKIETMGRNFDKTFGPDNDGIERNNTPIKNGGPDVLGFKYPLPEMYCSLTSGDRSQIEVSNNAGAFVCNNLAYQFAFSYPEVIFGFIHVPANNCRNLEAKTEKSVMNLERMILAAIKVKNVSRLMTGKKDIELLREASKDNKCLDEFYKRTKGVDEKGFWTVLGSR